MINHSWVRHLLRFIGRELLNRTHWCLAIMIFRVWRRPKNRDIWWGLGATGPFAISWYSLRVSTVLALSLRRL